MDPISEVKVRAERLQRQIEQGDAQALARVQRRGPGRGDRSLAAPDVRYKHCLSAVARELGFADYAHLLRVVDGDPGEADFGTLPCGRGSGGYLNAWYRDYDEAREHRQASAGFLLAYRRHFVVVESPYIREIVGVDPRDPDWAAIGFDWARPADLTARRRLYGRLFAQRPPAPPAASR